MTRPILRSEERGKEHPDRDADMVVAYPTESSARKRGRIQVTASQSQVRTCHPGLRDGLGPAEIQDGFIESSRCFEVTDVSRTRDDHKSRTGDRITELVGDAQW